MKKIAVPLLLVVQALNTADAQEQDPADKVTPPATARPGDSLVNRHLSCAEISLPLLKVEDKKHCELG
ncbi:hypothetical protein SAMN05518865_103100 [Duganella sp. CF458]|uniref:hypothetical protein n=1 Tax=Duganella sp. CF458 TaxID=1884368 RepID=UPI0008E70AF9|nr:hypothetical protein [Duganella sp. CF458]SFF67656.1 hypothetical protein SAMN05518865_103100 [Duganella sp. CF458]